MAVYNFGSINIDHIYSVPHFVQPGETLSSHDYQKVLGGKGANQSLAAARAGAEVFHVGAIHQSDEAIMEPMHAANIRCDYVDVQNEVASGHAIIQVNSEAENSIVLYGGANQCLSQEMIENALSNTSENDWVLIQNETNGLESIIKHAASKRLPIVFNPAPMSDAVKTLPLDLIDVLIVNEVEAMQLTNTTSVSDAQSALETNYSDLKIILTLGKQGVMFLHQHKRVQVSGFKVNAIDTTAAGDTFVGYFLANYMQQNAQEQSSESMSDILTLSCAAAAIAVTRKGAEPSIPVIDEVNAFMNNQ